MARFGLGRLGGIRGPRARGIAASEAAVLAGVVGAIAVAGVVIVPMSLRAQTAPAGFADRLPDDPALAETTAGLRSLVSSCRGVLFAENGPSPQAAFWASDARNPGVVDADEIILLRFNPTVGALAAYTRPVEEPAASAPSAPGVPASLIGAELLEVWRTRPRTERRIVAAHLEEVRFVTAAPDGAPPTLRVLLVWASRGVDDNAVEGEFEVRPSRGRGAPAPPA